MASLPFPPPQAAPPRGAPVPPHGVPPTAPRPLPPPGRKNAATLHLCAAAYLDRRFRDRVFDEVYRRPDRAVAPNPGTDAVPVLRHILRSRRIDVAQQLVLAVLLAVLLFAPVVNRLYLLAGLVAWAVVVSPLLAFAVQTNATLTHRLIVGAKWLLGGAAASAAVLVGLYYLVGWLGDRVFVAIDAYEYVDGDMRYSVGYVCVVDLDHVVSEGCIGYHSQFGLVPGAMGAGVWLLALGAVLAVFGAFQAGSVATIPTEREPMPPVNRRVHDIGESQRSPVVTYHASRSPFVGSGSQVKTWQFAMALRPADAAEGDDAAMSIDTSGLDDHIKGRLKQLGTDTETTRRLPSLAVGDHLYVSGRDVAYVVRHPQELANSGYPFRAIEQVQREPSMPVRHYLRCEVASWDGELVTSVFVHCALQGETLHMELVGCVLYPTRREYQIFGFGARSRRALILGGLARGAKWMPVMLVRSPFDTVRNAYRAVRRATGKPRGPRAAGADSGAVFGIRELGSSVAEQTYFQGRDAIKYVNILERQILDALTEYLRENNVDTSELEERVTAIVNNGVVNYGELNTGAAGKGARANIGSIGSGSRGVVKGA